MKEVLGQYGSIYRTGGDEFVVIAEIPVKDRDMAIKRLML
jgi:GGDEF domain-containing protein